MRALKLRPVTHVKGDRNGYCGPAAISALTGMSSGQAARLIRDVRGRASPVKGTSTAQVRRALGRCGVRVACIHSHRDPPTFAQWARKTHGERGGKVFLMVVGNHWQVVSGNRYVCGLTKGVVPISKAVKARGRKRVTEVYELEAPAGVTIPPEASRPARPGDREKSAFLKVARARGWKHRIDRSQGRDMTPDILIEPCPDFPVGIGTLHYDWGESLDRLQGVVTGEIEPEKDDDHWWVSL